MARIYPLFSSSKGNCTYIGSRDEGILIDCGVSYTRIKNALALNGIDISTAVKAVFITHEHHDHVCGLKTLTKKCPVPVFAQSYTLDVLLSENMLSGYSEDIKEIIEIGDIIVKCFPTSHDTKESCGYRIELPDGKICAVCTDLGYVSDIVEENLTGCGAVLIESNYDEEMLRSCGYPEYLKARIRSRRGHLSNTDCAALCARLIGKGTTHFILGHLSQDSNTPERALEVNRSFISGQGFESPADYLMTAAPVETGGGFISF